MKKFKRILVSILMAFSVLAVSGCEYIPPENSKRRHFTEEEALAYAQSLDPNAVLLESRDISGYAYEYREWWTRIHGVRCHVASVGSEVYNSGIGFDFLSKTFYVMDTDYDYYLLKEILKEERLLWDMNENNYHQFYQGSNVPVYVDEVEYELSDEELMAVWENACVVYEKYTARYGRRDLMVVINAPLEWSDGVVRMYSLWFDDFTEEERVEIFECYHELWQKNGDKLAQ